MKFMIYLTYIASNIAGKSVRFRDIDTYFTPFIVIFSKSYLLYLVNHTSLSKSCSLGLTS